LAHEKKFGRMVAVKGGQVTDVAIEEAVSSLKTLDMDVYKVAQVFFG
jgi:6-phosphofructokinase 1